MKNQILTIFFLIFIHSVSSQNVSTKSLIEKSNELNLDMWDLAEYAQENIKDETQLAYFFYYWIGSNIKYDHEILNKYETQNISHEKYAEYQKDYNVYENRKGICAGYANLFKWFMFEVDIEVAIIIGHIRDQRNHYVELASDDDFLHAWNAIKINGKWMLVDTTWGTSNNSEVSDYYFDINPKKFIITHYPEESKWQLLENPLSLEEFNNSKFISPIWFKVGYSDEPKLKKDDKYYYFVFSSNANKNWSVNLLFSNDNRNFKQIDEIEKINQDGYTYLRFDKTQIPKRAFFKVNLIKKNNEKHYTATYKDVINFKI